MTKFQQILKTVTEVFQHGAQAEDAWDDSENEDYLIQMTALIMETIERE
jgi:hypothetical protein